MAKTRTQYSLMNIGVNMGGYFLNTLMGFICRMVFVRCLPAEYLGISGLFGNILSMLSLAELGIGTAIVYALYKPVAENDQVKIASLMQLYGKAYRVIGIVVAVVGLALLPFLGLLVGETPDIKEDLHFIYVVYLFNTCLTYFFSYRATLLVAAQRNYIQQGLSYIITAVQSVLQVVALLLTGEYLLYLGIQTLGTIAFNLLISHKAVKDYPFIKDKDVPALSKEEKRSLFWNIKALAVSKISGQFVNGVDNIITTIFTNLATVGFVSNYSLISGAFSSLLGRIFNSVTASIGNLNAIENEKQQYRFFKILQFSCFALYGWSALIICFVSTDLVCLFFGDNYALPFEMTLLFAFNFYIVTMQHAVGIYQQTLGLFRYGQYVLIFTAILNLAFSVGFGSLWGLFGIYFATCLARVLTCTWYIPYAVFKHGLHKGYSEYVLPYAKYLVVIFICGLACFVLFSFVAFTPLFNSIIKSILCTAVFGITLVVFFRKTEEYGYLKSKIREIARLAKFKKTS